MKRNNYMLQLSHENYALKMKCCELQNEIQELKRKQEELYLNQANFILFLQSRNIFFDQIPIFHLSKKE